MNKITDKRKDCFYMIKQLHDNIEKNANNLLKKSKANYVPLILFQRFQTLEKIL